MVSESEKTSHTLAGDSKTLGIRHEPIGSVILLQLLCCKNFFKIIL